MNNTITDYKALCVIHAQKDKLDNIKDLLEQLETKRMQARHWTWFRREDIAKFLEQLKNIL